MEDKPNIYAARAGADGALDRCEAQRRDPGWIAARARDVDARFLPYHGDAHAFAADGALIVLGPEAVTAPAEALIFLGEDDAGAWFGVEADGADTPDDVDWSTLRLRGATLNWRDAARLSALRGLMIWADQARYCGRCASPLNPIRGGTARRCAACAEERFPVIAPAVIMLPVCPDPDGDREADRCVLAHGVRLPHGLYSTVAGFVEPGESLEDTVVRETQEELGLRVTHARYLHSQPWPFPNSLMVGFRAQVADGPLRLEDNEIADARWITRAALRALKETADFRLPRPDSIARRIVMDWARGEG